MGGRGKRPRTAKVAAYSTRDETVVEMRVLGERLLVGYDTKKDYADVVGHTLSAHESILFSVRFV